MLKEKGMYKLRHLLGRGAKQVPISPSIKKISNVTLSKTRKISNEKLYTW